MHLLPQSLPAARFSAILVPGSSISFRRFVPARMASVTAPPHTAPSALPSASAAIRIEPPRALFALRLREVSSYRELLYFFVWRDVTIRYKPTSISLLSFILQPHL